jgi:hypothetical protein
MGGGGKAESTSWRGPAGAPRPPHGGNYSALGNERAKPLAFPLIRKRRRQPPLAATRHNSGTLARRDAAGWCARATMRQRPSGKERGKSASGSAQRSRTLRSAQRGTECVLRKSRSPFDAPDRHPNGPRPWAWCAQRIERVARKGSGKTDMTSNRPPRSFIEKPT